MYRQEELSLVEKINLCNVNLNNILHRLSAVSDLVLKEQLGEECIELENDLSLYTMQLTQLTTIIYQDIFSKGIDDLYIFYLGQFKPEENQIIALEKTNNISIMHLVKKFRIRIIPDYIDRKNLIDISTMLKCKIIIKDMQNIILDVVNIYEKELILYVGCLNNQGLNLYSLHGQPLHAQPLHAKPVSIFI